MTRPRATTSPSDALGATIADLKARLARLENIAHQHNTPASDFVRRAGDTMTGDLRIEAPNAEGLYVGSDSDQVTDTKSIKVQSRGYAGILLDGDTDNVAGEPGGAFVRLQQDGGLISGRLVMVNSSGDDGEGGSYSGSLANSLLVGTDGNYRVQFGTNGTVRMALAGNGDLDIGGLNNWSSGSNANGRFVRFPDGTQLCQGSVTISPVANTPTSTTWTYPASFAGAGGDVAVFATATTGVPGTRLIEVSVTSIGTSSASIVMFRTNTTNTGVRCMAIGRWF